VALLALKLVLLAAGLVVGLLGGSRKPLARVLLRPVLPSADTQRLSRGECFGTAAQYFRGFALVFVAAVALAWLSETVSAHEALVATLAVVAVAFLIAAGLLLLQTCRLIVHGAFKPHEASSDNAPTNPT